MLVQSSGSSAARTVVTECFRYLCRSSFRAYVRRPRSHRASVARRCSHPSLVGKVAAKGFFIMLGCLEAFAESTAECVPLLLAAKRSATDSSDLGGEQGGAVGASGSDVSSAPHDGPMSSTAAPPPARPHLLSEDLPLASPGKSFDGGPTAAPDSPSWGTSDGSGLSDGRGPSPSVSADEYETSSSAESEDSSTANAVRQFDRRGQNLPGTREDPGASAGDGGARAAVQGGGSVFTFPPAGLRDPQLATREFKGEESGSGSPSTREVLLQSLSVLLEDASTSSPLESHPQSRVWHSSDVSTGPHLVEQPLQECDSGSRWGAASSSPSRLGRLSPAPSISFAVLQPVRQSPGRRGSLRARSESRRVFTGSAGTFTPTGSRTDREQAPQLPSSPESSRRSPGACKCSANRVMCR